MNVKITQWVTTLWGVIKTLFLLILASKKNRKGEPEGQKIAFSENCVCGLDVFIAQCNE